MRAPLPLILLMGLMIVTGCGGHSGTNAGGNTVTTSGQNIQQVSVNSGPTGTYVNGLFTTISVCLPGSTTSCQSISGVLVDTGSEGLRILSSPTFTLSLPAENDANSNPIATCGEFLDGFVWGPVKTADIHVGSEVANSVPVQIIADPNFSTVPSSCSSSGGTNENTLTALGANAILGIGSFRQDCGSACSATDSSNPGVYFSCPSSGCVATAVSLAAQLQNPVWKFPQDNNGTIIELPAISSSGVASVSGSLVFGIGTESNNGLGSAKVFTLDQNGNFTTSFNNQAYPGSFIDSASNGLFILNSTATGISTCSDNSDFYCPSSTQNLTATNQGTNGTSGNVNFSIANADSLFSNQTNFVFNDLGGPSTPSMNFDWGLPFFLGRNVFTAIEGQNTSAGVGPFFAY